MSRKTRPIRFESLEDRTLLNASPELVANIYPGWDSSPFYLTEVGGSLFFNVNDGTHGYELWKSDGTSAGTVLVKDINSGADRSSPISLTEVGGTLFFSADDGTHGRELWKSDGASAGTVLVKDINPGTDQSSPFYLTEVGGTLFFIADNGTQAASCGRAMAPVPARSWSKT